MDKVTRLSVRYIDQFVDVMHNGLAICLKESWNTKGEDPGRFVEEVLPLVEKLTGETGQVAVWIAYAIFEA